MAAFAARGGRIADRCAALVRRTARLATAHRGSVETDVDVHDGDADGSGDGPARKSEVRATLPDTTLRDTTLLDSTLRAT
jgi:hypothetical protein